MSSSFHMLKEPSIIVALYTANIDIFYGIIEILFPSLTTFLIFFS